MFCFLALLEHKRERPVISSKVYNISIRVHQSEIDSVQRSLGHVHGIIDGIRCIEKHLRVVRLDGDLLNDNVVAEVRNYVIASEARAGYIYVSNGV